jgi:hypothetical protein
MPGPALDRAVSGEATTTPSKRPYRTEWVVIRPSPRKTRQYQSTNRAWTYVIIARTHFEAFCPTPIFASLPEAWDNK